MAPPCRLSAKARCESRLRHANTSAASAAAAMPSRRNSTGTTSQPESAAYLSKAPTPKNETTMPTLTGTLPSVNQRFTRSINCATKSGGADGAGICGAGGARSGMTIAGASYSAATGSGDSERGFGCGCGYGLWRWRGNVARGFGGRAPCSAASTRRTPRLFSTSVNRRRSVRSCPSNRPMQPPSNAAVPPVGSSNMPAQKKAPSAAPTSINRKDMCDPHQHASGETLA